MGLTQEELAWNVGFSDRSIRKAEMGKRVDVRTIKTLHQYFVGLGQLVELSDLVVEELLLADQMLPAKWFENVYEQQSHLTAVGLLSENCLINFDGVSIDMERMPDLMNVLISNCSEIEIRIDYQASRGEWHVLGWKTRRHMKRSDGETGDAAIVEICGITSFRIEHERVIELREFTDSALYYPSYHQLLLSHGQQIGGTPTSPIGKTK